MPKPELVDIQFEGIIHETDRAWLIDFGIGDSVWLPKSQCEVDQEGKIVTMSAKLAEEKGVEDNAI